MTTKTTEKSRVAPAPAIRTWRERISVGADFPLHAPTDVERAMEAEIAELRTLIALRVMQLGAQVGAQWTKQPPTEQADYWHWSGHDEDAPMIYHVLWSGSANKCFLSIGQHGIKNSIWCDEFGGWWQKIEQPAIPPWAGAENEKGGVA